MKIPDTLSPKIITKVNWATSCLTFIKNKNIVFPIKPKKLNTWLTLKQKCIFSHVLMISNQANDFLTTRSFFENVQFYCFLSTIRMQLVLCTIPSSWPSSGIQHSIHLSMNANCRALKRLYLNSKKDWFNFMKHLYSGGV